MTSAWNESTLTWNRMTGTPKEGTYTSSGSLSFSFSYSQYSTASINVKDVVQSWADDPSTNYGWMFWAVELYGQSTTWATDDYGTASYRLRLTVTYEEPPESLPVPVPEPMTVGLFAVSLIGIAVRTTKKA